MKPVSPPPRVPATPILLGARLRRLACYVVGAMALLYVVAVTSGYVWLRHGRGVETVRVGDVALLRVDTVRQSIGRQHYARAKIELEKENYQAAYISFATALRQDPANVEGRLAAARFMRLTGAANQSLNVLEEGLIQAPGEPELIRATFEYLLSNGRTRYLFELIKREYGDAYTGEGAALVRLYQLRAVLAVEGAEAADAFLRQHPELREAREAMPALAELRWILNDREEALKLMTEHVEKGAPDAQQFAQLAVWQLAVGRPDAAITTADRARKKFPKDPMATVLLIEMRAAKSPTGAPFSVDIGAFLREFGDQPGAIAAMAATSGRKGWVTLSRLLYEYGAHTQADLGLLGLNYADALLRTARYAEVNDVLTQIDAQCTDRSSEAFLLQLRMRQVIAAGALGNPDHVREAARRLATLVRNEPDRAEGFRQFFLKSGLPDAAAAMGPRPATPRPSTTLSSPRTG